MEIISIKRKHILIFGIITLLSAGIILSSNWNYFIKNNHNNNNALNSYQINVGNSLYPNYFKEEVNIIFQINILKSAIKNNNIMYHQYNNVFKHNISYVRTQRNSIRNKIKIANYTITHEIEILNTMKTIINNHPYNYLKFFQSKNYTLPEMVSQKSTNNYSTFDSIKTKNQSINSSNVAVKNIAYQSEEAAIGIGAISSIVKSSKTLIFSKNSFYYNNIYFFSNITNSISTHPDAARIKNKNNSFSENKNKFISNKKTTFRKTITSKNKSSHSFGLMNLFGIYQLFRKHKNNFIIAAIALPFASIVITGVIYAGHYYKSKLLNKVKVKPESIPRRQESSVRSSTEFREGTIKRRTYTGVESHYDIKTDTSNVIKGTTYDGQISTVPISDERDTHTDANKPIKNEDKLVTENSNDELTNSVNQADSVVSDLLAQSGSFTSIPGSDGAQKIRVITPNSENDYISGYSTGSEDSAPSEIVVEHNPTSGRHGLEEDSLLNASTSVNSISVADIKDSSSWGSEEASRLANIVNKFNYSKLEEQKNKKILEMSINKAFNPERIEYGPEYLNAKLSTHIFTKETKRDPDKNVVKTDYGWFEVPIFEKFNPEDLNNYVKQIVRSKKDELHGMLDAIPLPQFGGDNETAESILTNQIYHDRRQLINAHIRHLTSGQSVTSVEDANNSESAAINIYNTVHRLKWIRTDRNTASLSNKEDLLQILEQTTRFVE